MTPRQFAERILKKKLHAYEVHEGFNFRFGHKAAGDMSLLSDFGREMGFEVKVYPEMTLRGETVSSSRIRTLLTEGRVSRARHLLARPFSIVGTPGRGRGYGSKYTVPTINLARYEELVPKDGVYITWTRVGAERFDSVTNVGNRPTFGAELFAVETHLLNFHPIDLSPETEVEICFLERLRDEVKFPSVDALREQIARDVKRARRYFHLLAKNNECGAGALARLGYFELEAGGSARSVPSALGVTIRQAHLHLHVHWSSKTDPTSHSQAASHAVGRLNGLGARRLRRDALLAGVGASDARSGDE